MNAKVKEMFKNLIGIIVLFVMVVVLFECFIHVHTRKCPVCQNEEHCKVCDQLDRNAKAEYDQEHGCSYFWCPHYNGR